MRSAALNSGEHQPLVRSRDWVTVRKFPTDRMVEEHHHQITNSCFAGWRKKLQVLLFFLLLSGKLNSLLLSPGCIELQILQPFFDYRCLDRGQLFLPPTWPDPTV